MLYFWIQTLKNIDVMRKIVILFLLINFSVLRLTSQNLVLNPSFETFSPCPTGPSELPNAANWKDPYLNIIGDTCSTSDLYNACNPLGSFGVDVPVNIMGTQAARTGVGYAGIIIYEGISLAPGDCSSMGGSGWREYLAGELSSPMVAGQQYCVSFWVSLADTVKWGSNNFGVHLSNTPIAINCGSVGSNSDLSSYGVMPQLVYAGGPILNTIGWSKLEWTYTAIGGERYLTLGNFYGNSSTNYVCSNANAFNPYAYYYVDDVSVVAGACCDASIAPINTLCSDGSAVTLLTNTSGGTWSSLPVTAGLNTSLGAFNPTIAGPGTYTVYYTLGCGADSVIINVSSCTSMSVCVESNGSLTVSGGAPAYTWAAWNSATSTPITNSAQCTACGYTWAGFACLNGVTPATSCATPAGFANFGTGVNVTPPVGKDTIRITDGLGNTLVINGLSTLPSCSATCDATITQAGPFCTTATVVNLTAVQTGGTWSGTGITNASTGTFNPTTAGAGSHVITYNLSCGDVDTMTIVVNATQSAAFSYASGSYCLSDPNPTPTIAGVSGGTFTINNSGVIIPSTGVINLASSGVGSYTVTYTTTGICPGTATFNVTITNSTNATITQAGPFCSNAASVNLTAVSPGGTWTGTGITNGTTGTFNPATAGVGSHVITYIISGSCGSVDTMTIVVNTTQSSAFSYSSGNFCLTDPNPNPTITGVTGGTFTINNGGVIGSSTGIINITSSGSGAFVVTYTTSGTCPASQTFNVNINSCTTPQPVANFSTSQINICVGDCISFTDLSTSSAVGGITVWSWSFTGATPNTFGTQNPTNICYNTAGTYQVSLTVTDANGSDSEIKTTYIIVTSCTTPITNFSISDTAICSGNCINFTDMSSGATSWQWSFQNGTPPTSSAQHPSNICYNTAGTHSIKLVTSNAFGSDSLIKYVTVYPTQVVFAGNDTTIQLNQSAYLNAIGLSANGTYSWTPPFNLTCTTCPNPTATPGETVTYTVITTDSNGCKSSDNITIIVQFQNVIFVPNIFSPNGDGVNDILFVRGKGVEKLKFFIYDRWGEKVFETTSLDVGWDGSFRGKDMNKAVFVYYLEATFIDGQEVTQKGDITLVK